MRDRFLQEHCESQQTYDETIRYLKKHHPLCQEKGVSDEWKEELISNAVNSMIRKIVFEKQTHIVDIPNMLVATKLRSGSILLAVSMRGS